ncbi:MAG TPA: L,D-transpeptidase [Vicinamibacteria bacterium]|nr:L,D-transpeptidase [Vicinamibacteria bacterium]
MSAATKAPAPPEVMPRADAVAAPPPPSRLADRAKALLGRRGVRVAAGSLLLLLLALAGTGWDFHAVPAPGADVSVSPPAKPAGREAQRLLAERQRLETALRRKVPRGPWIVIDQTHNRLRLMRGEDLVLEAPCSAGSGMVLKEGSGGRVWVFDTPRGRFEVLAKLANPVWRKPDWAFVEEGEPIPKDPGDRLEYGSLGEYALYFGNGYMIHGTLYERLLGRPVSHGCVRLGKEPLREVYRQAPLGTPVYIY